MLGGEGVIDRNNDYEIRCHAHAERGGRRRLDCCCRSRNDNVIIYTHTTTAVLCCLPIIITCFILLSYCANINNRVLYRVRPAADRHSCSNNAPLCMALFGSFFFDYYHYYYYYYYCYLYFFHRYCRLTWAFVLYIIISFVSRTSFDRRPSFLKIVSYIIFIV